MTDVFSIIFKAFLGACGAGILTLIIMCIKWFIKKIKADDITIKALAHDAYFRHCRYLIESNRDKEVKSITEAESENHDYLYAGYKAQGLNGTGERMHKVISEMEVIPNSPERKG